MCDGHGSYIARLCVVRQYVCMCVTDLLLRSPAIYSGSTVLGKIFANVTVF